MRRALVDLAYNENQSRGKFMLDAASSLEAVHHWHRDTHWHDMRSVLTNPADSIGFVSSFADDLNVS